VRALKISFLDSKYYWREIGEARARPFPGKKFFLSHGGISLKKLIFFPRRKLYFLMSSFCLCKNIDLKTHGGIDED